MATFTIVGLALWRSFHGHHHHGRSPLPWSFLGMAPIRNPRQQQWLNFRSLSSDTTNHGSPPPHGVMEEFLKHPLQHSLLGGLAKHAPAFPVKGRNVEVLDTPSQFYDTLKTHIMEAKERVFISALYMGTGPLELDLLDVVADSLSSNTSLKVMCLFDALRSTRIVRSEDGKGSTSQLPKFKSSAEMLAQKLLDKSAKWKKAGEKEDRVKIALYRTPELTKSLEKFLPTRLNEIIGVCHMKVYIFDNHVLMSGANLSSSYFTNRQDRYILLRDCRNLADYFCELVETVASFSYKVDTGGTLQGNAANIDPRSNPVLFRRKIRSALKQMLDRHIHLSAELTLSSELVGHEGGLWLGGHCADTWVFPTVQIGSLGIFQDELCILWMLANLPAASRVHFASAYFNLTKEFQAALVQASTEKLIKIITAAPQANGFYGSKGLSGFIPKAYSLLERDFYEQTCKQVSQDACNNLNIIAKYKSGIQLFEYNRPEWTFHAKGMWCYFPTDGTLPSMTLIGSSNFGFRSRQRDIEAQLFMVTSESSFRKKLQEETDRLFAHGQRVHHTAFLEPDRSGGPVSAFAAQLVRSWL